MGGNYKPVKGDRVRVVIEGEVSWTSPHTENYEIDGQYIDVNHNQGEIVSVEKIEPPVEVFKPGDRVRDRLTGHEYTLAEGGYVSHRANRWMKYTRTATQPNHWTSKNYEKVNVG